MHLDSHIILVVGFGVLALLVAWLPLVVSRLPLSLAMVCLAFGFVFLAIPQALTAQSYSRTVALERLSEVVLIVAIMGSGLSLDRRIGWRRWASTWRLLGIAMPLGFAAMLALALYWGQYTLPAAAVIAAVLSPTDPVLASDLRVGPPGTGEEGEVRHALTSEAGLNDGLAAPFVMLALALSRGESPGFAWVAEYFVWKVVLGAGIGWLVGRTMGWFRFGIPRIRNSEVPDGLAAIGMAFIAYGIAEALGGYGFVAVFLCAIRLRDSCRNDEGHKRMVDFAEQIERLFAMLIIVLFAGAISTGLLAALTWKDVALAAMFLLVVRPLFAYLALIGTPHPRVSRAATAFFGIRGIGTFYYLVYAMPGGSFADSARVISLSGAVVLASIVIHGVAATPVMRALDRIRARSQA